MLRDLASKGPSTGRLFLLAKTSMVRRLRWLNVGFQKELSCSVSTEAMRKSPATSIEFGAGAVLALVEAKQPSTMTSAGPQIEAECLALLEQTFAPSSSLPAIADHVPNRRRAFFAGVLTNGIEYMFYVAHKTTKATTVFSSTPYIAGADDGLIAAIVVEIIRSPNVLPSIFRTRTMY